MNVALHARREIIVHDQVDSPKVHTSSHQLRCNQNPNPPLPKLLHDPLPLRRCPLRMDHIDMQPVVDELVEKVVGSRNGLNEDEARGLESEGGCGGG
jgi:hypothetical protein